LLEIPTLGVCEIRSPLWQ